MFEFGLTGGIGSGKSTAAAGLVARGATLIDADAIVARLQEPGEDVFVAMVEHFGPSILLEDGSLDRQAVANIVFREKSDLKALNNIVHPRVASEIASIREDIDDPKAVVVMDIPLLVRFDGKRNKARQYKHLRGVIVVDCDLDVAMARLVEFRGFSKRDVRARMENQASRTDRVAVADHVINNSGTLEDLEPQLDACWEWMRGVAAAR